MNNEQKPILVTGCSSGIGQCIALSLAKRNYPVYATVRDEKDLIQFDQTPNIKALVLDLNNSNSIRTAWNNILDDSKHGLYALINNGAFGLPGAVEDLSRDALRAQFETNVFGTHEITCLGLKQMRSQGFGRIIQISSVLGFISMAYRGAYNASKHALEGLTDTLRLELMDTDIHVSSIQPGPILSRFRQNSYAAFCQHIDAENSLHQTQYASMIKRLVKTEAGVPFTLPADAVYQKALHALEAHRPKARYSVTVPTYLFAVLKRILPVNVLDKALWYAGGQGKR